MVKTKLRIVLLMLCILATAVKMAAQPKNKKTDDEAARKQWVDSVYNKLTEDERIGQLFMVAAYSGGKNYNEDQIIKLLAAHQIGGLIFMQGGPVRQANLTNEYQQMAQVPLLLSMDAEWGLGMRLDSMKNLPRQMMLGATRDTLLAYNMGSVIAYQCKRLGVHIDFAPVIDVNNNAANPVINSRSFGEDKTYVAKLGIAYMRGLQNHGVMACAKHFPGHGDTNVDSHKDLPVITKSLAQLDTLEFYPFKQLIKAGVQSVMIAHLEVPALETEPHVPTTLSKNTVTNVLKSKLGFNGLIFTDALNMQGVTKYFAAGDDDLMAFEAGDDVLLFSQDVPTAIGKIRGALDSGKIPMSQLETSVKKILAAKYNAGLNNWKPVSTYHITEDLNQYTDSLKLKIAKEAVTTVRDDNGIINKINGNMHVSYVGLNMPMGTNSSFLYNTLQDSLQIVKPYWLPKGSTEEQAMDILNKTANDDATILVVHNLNFTPGNNYGLDAVSLSLLQQAQLRNNVLVVLQGNAYALQNFCSSKSVIVAYDDDTLTELAVSKVLLKKQRAHGKLPVTPCVGAPAIAVVPEKPVSGAAVPYELTETDFVADAGVTDAAALDKLDFFIQRCIADGVFPGCRVLAARNGKVFYNKSFGYYRYNKQTPVDKATLYDMASVTKVLATTLAVMRLYENGKLKLDKTIGDYLPWTKGTDKANLVVRNLLLHQAGLKSWIPFYKETLDEKGNPRADLYRKAPEPNFTTQVAKDFYIRNDYVDTVWNRILTSPLENKGKFVYSDLDFYFLAAIVEHITGTTIDKYVDEQFYKPMGLKHITYKPLNKFDTSVIAPTEEDIFFRHQLLQGYVHDPGAALQGGVAGHAGIFATADDVAAIFQMLLNKGTYRGRRYFQSETVNYFTAYHSAISHRGLGFDKPTNDSDNGGPAGDRVTGYAFGHQGFTGTCAWADPATGVVFVLLSNRVYPSSDNTKINHLNVRTVAQDYIYEALGLPVNHDRPAVWSKETKTK